MNPGDLVKTKFSLYSKEYMTEPMYKEFGSDKIGIVIESHENAAKVMFPRSGSVRVFLKHELEIINLK